MSIQTGLRLKLLLANRAAEFSEIFMNNLDVSCKGATFGQLGAADFAIKVSFIEVDKFYVLIQGFLSSKSFLANCAFNVFDLFMNCLYVTFKAAF